MRYLIISLFLFTITLLDEKEVLILDKNKTDLNSTNLEQLNIEKAIKQEEKFKKEQKFYLGDDYNLSEHKIDPKSLDKIKPIEPYYDFDMANVYSD